MPRGGKPVSRLRAERGAVHNNVETTGKRPGGITGKGFLPGHSGNAGGRPKKRPISAALERIGAQKLPERWRQKFGLWKGATWFDGVAMAMHQAAAKGNPAAAKEIREAIEGKAPQRIELDAEIDFESKKLTHETLLEKLGLDAARPVQ